MHAVDFKCELRDVALAEALCRRAHAVFLATLTHVDTYFRVASGRLLRRQHQSGPAEWVAFTRPEQIAPRLATVTLYSDAAARERFGAIPLPVWLVLQKRRDVWISGDVRVHLDDVESLGRFVEFESRVSPRRPLSRCRQEIARVHRLLAPALGEPISCGYSDLAQRERDWEPPRPALPPGPG